VKRGVQAGDRPFGWRRSWFQGLWEFELSLPKGNALKNYELRIENYELRIKNEKNLILLYSYNHFFIIFANKYK